jgi:hypothetical protein
MFGVGPDFASLSMAVSFVGQFHCRPGMSAFIARRISFLRWIVVLLLANGLICPLWAESENAAPEALLKPWTEATARFQKSREGASEGLIRLLDGAEEKARGSGDLEKVKSIKQERAQFLQDQTLPKCVKTATYEKALEAAKTSLRAAAQKAKIALVRQKYDEDAATIDQELGELVGTAKAEFVKGKPGAVGPPDGRNYWVEKKEKGNEFRWMKPLEWIETTHDGTNKQYHFKEIARTTEYVEIYDSARELGVRLHRKTAEQATNYREAQTNAFSSWTEGAWVVEPSDVIYLSDLPEKPLKPKGFEKHGMIPNDPAKSQIYLGNRPSPKGLLTHPGSRDPAVVSYEIGSLHKNVFRAKIGVADLLHTDPVTPLKFVVLGDGKRLFTSELVRKCGTPQECEIQIRGVNELVLRVECDGASDFALAVWCEPRLSAK